MEEIQFNQILEQLTRIADALERTNELEEYRSRREAKSRLEEKRKTK